MIQASVHRGEHCRQGALRRTLAAFSGSTLPEGKEDNAARGAATALKTNVHPCTLMQPTRAAIGRKFMKHMEEF